MENVKNFFRHFSNVKNIVFIITLRDTLVSLGSTCDKWLKYENENGLNAQTLYDNLFSHIKLFKEIKSLIEETRVKTATVVNSSITLMYWQIGEKVNNEILRNKRAEYGKEIVNSLSRELIVNFEKSYSKQNF